MSYRNWKKEVVKLQKEYNSLNESLNHKRSILRRRENELDYKAEYSRKKSGNSHESGDYFKIQKDIDFKNSLDVSEDRLKNLYDEFKSKLSEYNKKLAQYNNQQKDPFRLRKK